MKTLYILMALQVFFYPAALSQTPKRINCVMKYAVLTSEKMDGFEISKPSDSALIITKLNTKNPLLVGNLGNEELFKLREDLEQVILGEMPPLGGVNIFTYFIKAKILMVSKQYHASLAGPLGLLWVGNCKTSPFGR